MTKGIMNQVRERIIWKRCRLVTRPKRMMKRTAAPMEGR